PAQTFALIGEAACDALFLAAKRLLARLERGFALLELRKALQACLKLRLARRQRRRRLDCLRLARGNCRLALVEAGELFESQTKLGLPLLELGLGLADRSLAAVQLCELCETRLQTRLTARELPLRQIGRASWRGR